jgi:hypothetical protein
MASRLPSPVTVTIDVMNGVTNARSAFRFAPPGERADEFSGMNGDARCSRADDLHRAGSRATKRRIAAGNEG